MTAELDLDALAALVQPLDAEASAATRERLDSLARSPDALGRLDELTVWLAGAQGSAPPRDPDRARVIVFAGEHGVAYAGVSAYPPEATAWMFQLAHSGGSAVSSLARTVGASSRLLDLSVDATTPEELRTYKVRRGSGRIDQEDALTLAEAETAFRNGIAIADEEVDGGADLLIPGELGVAASTVAAVLIAALTDSEPVKVIGRGSGIDDRAWMRKVVAIRDGLRRARPFAGRPDRAARGRRRRRRRRDDRLPRRGGGPAHAGAPRRGAVRGRRARRARDRAERGGVVAGRAPLRRTGADDRAAVPRPGAGARPRASAPARAPARWRVLPLLRAGVRACAETSTAEDANLPRISESG